MQLTILRFSAGPICIIPERVQYDVVREKGTGERTGVAKASVPKKKKNEMYEERRIAEFLSGFTLMKVSTC